MGRWRLFLAVNDEEEEATRNGQIGRRGDSRGGSTDDEREDPP